MANSLSPVITISIHVPAWGTTLRTLELMSILRFQSTFPRGERPRKDTVRFILDNFNPRSRVGNDNCRTKRRRVCARFQSTFPRGERLLLRRRCLKNSVFQSTFPRGERRPKAVSGPSPENFNPRSRVGNDGNCSSVRMFPFISIHVPAWGTTGRSHCDTCCRIYFNPRSRVGNDCLHQIRSYSLMNFNPRSRVGNDGNEQYKNDSIRAFQSTFPRGERQGTECFAMRFHTISIHVPAWGTTAHVGNESSKKRFQSTFPRGERRNSSVGHHRNLIISIHVPAWGTTEVQYSRL